MTRLLGAELLKLRTVRTPTGLLLAAALVGAVGAAGAVASTAVDHPEGAERLAETAGVVSILAVVLGALVVTTEFRHGTITQTFLVTPERERVVAAKLVAGALAGLAVGGAAVAATLAVALPWAGARGYDLGWDAAAAWSFLRLLGAFALWGALGVAVGALVRNQVGALVGIFVWFLMLEPLLAVLGTLAAGDFGQGIGPVAPYLPGTAFDALVGGDIGGAREGLPSPLAGLGLVLAYVTALAAAGTAAIVRRDPK